MGKYNDFINLSIGLLNGPMLYGSTLVGTSEFVPIVLAQNVKGGHFRVPDTECLVNIPYELLEKDMEVIVSPHVLPGPITVARKKYYLHTMPPAGLRVDEIVGFNLNTDLDQYWTEIDIGEVVDPVPGLPGTNGWTPVFSSVSDGPSRVVQRIIGYFGGTGTAPGLDPVQNYLGPAGLTTIGNATNIKGPEGSAALVRPMYNAEVGTSDLADIAVSSTNGFLLLQTIDVVNTFGHFRDFVIRGKVFFRRTNGGNSQFAVVNLKYKESAKLAGIVAGTSWNPDPNIYRTLESRRELVQCVAYVDDVGIPKSDQMMTVEGTIGIPAGSTFSLYLSCRVNRESDILTANLLRSTGKIRVIGI